MTREKVIILLITILIVAVLLDRWVRKGYPVRLTFRGIGLEVNNLTRLIK